MTTKLLSPREIGVWHGCLPLIDTDGASTKLRDQQRRAQHVPAQTSEQDAIFMCLTERVYDAIAQGEIQSLGLDQAAVIESMVEKTLALLE